MIAPTMGEDLCFDLTDDYDRFLLCWYTWGLHIAHVARQRQGRWYFESSIRGEPSGPREWQGETHWPTRESAATALDEYCDANGADPDDFMTWVNK